MAVPSLSARTESRGRAALVPSGADTRPGWSLPSPLVALAAGGLPWLCHFPVGLGGLAWVALVPTLCLMRRDMPTRRACLLAWLAGLLYYASALHWVGVADVRMLYGTWPGLSLACSLIFLAGFALVRRLDRTTGLPLVLTAPAIWTALEYLRAHLLGGFPWYFLSHTQHDYLPVIQIADVTGAYGVSFLVVAVNVVAFEWLARGAWFRRLLALRPGPTAKPWALPAQTATVGLLAVGVLTYGYWRLGQNDFTPGPRVALIQGNVDQRLKNRATDQGDEAAVRVMEDHFEALSDRAAAGQPRPDLIVWPETSYVKLWVEEPAGAPVPESQKAAREAAARWRTNLLLGISAWEVEDKDHFRRYNSALLVRPDGAGGPRYSKIHRVPFGEYVPFKDWIPFMNRFAPYDYDYSIRPGETQTRFPLGGTHFGVLICYEDTDPCLARQFVTPDGPQPRADFLLNISNDGWFDGTSEHEEHLAICRFRAVESRRPVARAVNMGVSAIVDGNGRVLRPNAVPAAGGAPVWEIDWQRDGLARLPVAEWARFKKVAGVVTGVLPLDGRASLYARWGDWLPQLCWLAVGFGLVLSFRGSRRVQS